MHVRYESMHVLGQIVVCRLSALKQNQKRDKKLIYFDIKIGWKGFQFIASIAKGLVIPAFSPD